MSIYQPKQYQLRPARPRGMGFLDSEGFDDSGWAFDGYGWYDAYGGYYDPNSDSYFDPNAGDWFNANSGYSDPYSEDASGNWQLIGDDGSLYQGGADGSLYVFNGTTGEEINIEASGEYTWTDAYGNSYFVNAQGEWTSTGADGLICYGDAAGNGGCTDGTQYSASAGRPNPIRQAAEAARAAAMGSSPGGSASGQRPQQQQQQQPRPTGYPPQQGSMFSAQDKKFLAYAGLALLAAKALKVI